MDMQTSGVEPVNLSDILSLATWERERTSEELQSFINTRHAALDSVGDLDI